MTWADYLIVSVLFHYLAAGVLYWWIEDQPLLLGLYWCYAGANVFAVLIARAIAKTKGLI